MNVQMSDLTLREIMTNCHPMLVRLINTVLMFWEGDIVITSFNRTWKRDKELGGSGIHASGPPWRAIDFDGPAMTQEKLEALADKVNDIWSYDRSRPTLKCVVATPHGTGKHAHIQVCSSTERKFI